MGGDAESKKTIPPGKAEHFLHVNPKKAKEFKIEVGCFAVVSGVVVVMVMELLVMWWWWCCWCGIVVGVVVVLLLVWW